MNRDILGALNPLNPAEGKTSFSDTQTPTTTSSFSSLMQKGPSSPPLEHSSLLSPLDLAQGGIKPNLATATPQNLLSQMQLMKNSMSNIYGQMSYPNLKMTPSQRHLVKNKLLSANATLRAVQERMGFTEQEQEDSSKDPQKQAALESTKKTAGPVGQFLNYITNGMDQLEAAKSQLAHLQAKADTLNAADFLFIQIKLAKAQQEIEFTSILLSKVVDSFKTIMN